MLDEQGNAVLQLEQLTDPSFSGLTMTSAAVVQSADGIVFVTDPADVVLQ